MSNQCDTIFPWADFKDISGCLKPHGHNDEHVCRTNKGELMAWQDDYECTCGCWEEDDGHPCMIYWKVDDIINAKK
jgi:hypothetical protein